MSSHDVFVLFCFFCFFKLQCETEQVTCMCGFMLDTFYLSANMFHVMRM